jgi:hypothetical protein
VGGPEVLPPNPTPWNQMPETVMTADVSDNTFIDVTYSTVLCQIYYLDGLLSIFYLL